MNKSLTKDLFPKLQILILTCIISYCLFLWQGHVGFSLGDEGFLWYGAQRVMIGEVPILDFFAYDPGRYYWIKLFMVLWNDNSIIAVRKAAIIFQAIGLFVGLIIVARTKSKQNLLYIFLATIALVTWMFPYYKAFDYAISIMLIWVLTFLIENPSKQRFFISGVLVGLASIFGRNHGVYGGIASLGVFSLLAIKRQSGSSLSKSVFLWCLGIPLGFLPLLVMAILIPGFATAYWESILFLSEIKTTNLPKPIPWPWNVPFDSMPLDMIIRNVLIGIFFLAIVAFGIIAVCSIIYQRLHAKHVNPCFAATAFLALPYAQYAFSRADVVHLSQGIFPFLIGCIILVGGRSSIIKWPLITLLCISSLWVMQAFQPGLDAYLTKRYKETNILGTGLNIDPRSFRDVNLIKKLANEYSPDGRSYLVVPLWPGAYPLLGRKSPIWEIYPLFPRSQSFQLKEIERIKQANPGFALIYDIALDGRDELRFKNTHSLVYNYIVDNFDLIPGAPDPNYQIYKSKKFGQ